MSSVERNRLRDRAMRVARSFKDLFRPGGYPRRGLRLVAAAVLWLLRIQGDGAVRSAILYRIAFTSDGETLRIAANHVLADLRDYTFGAKSAFDPDPIIMARRQGRRDVWLRITQYLNLDEEQVQKLMEIDDGI